VTDSVESAAEAIRRRVLGPDGPTPHAPATEAEAAFSALAAREIWAGVWDRPGLELSTPRAITMAVLVALGRPESLALHVRGALADGMTAEEIGEIGEIVLHCAPYCGAPAADLAFRSIRPLLEGTGQPDPTPDIRDA
jgi:alkylhydroperoxidase/carboxymuconolactone decarboxylase family protein YurZ